VNLTSLYSNLDAENSVATAPWNSALQAGLDPTGFGQVYAPVLGLWDTMSFAHGRGVGTRWSL